MEINFDSIKDAIDFAGDTGSAAGKIAKAADAIQNLFRAAKISADPNVKLAMSELMLQVANTQAANAQLLQRLTALETQIEAAKTKQADLDRYELWKTPAGATVYRLKEGDDTGEPPHFLCPNCMHAQRKSILQGKGIAKCNPCKTRFAIATRKARTM